VDTFFRSVSVRASRAAQVLPDRITNSAWFLLSYKQYIIRRRQLTATPRKLQPLASALPTGFDGDPFSLRSPTNAGKKRSDPLEMSRRESPRHHSSGGGAMNSDSDAFIAGGCPFTNNVVPSPSLDILACDHRGAGDLAAAAALRPTALEASESAAETMEAMIVPLPAPAMLDDPLRELASTRGRQGTTMIRSQGIPRGEQDSAAGGDIEWDGEKSLDMWTDIHNIEEQGRRERKERRQPLRRTDGEDDRESEGGTEGAVYPEVEAGDLASTAGCEATRAEGNARDGAAGRQGMTESRFAPAVRNPTTGTRRTGAIETSCCNAVLPMALPGEAHEASFGAVARGVVLASGSSRFQVSRCDIEPVSGRGHSSFNF